jgi:rRNA biogenesis protein RRP5
MAIGKDGIARDVEQSTIKLGDIVRGYVVNTSKAGCFIALSRALIVRCQLKNLSNKFVANPSESYPTGKLVTARVKAIDDGKIEVTLKKSAVNAPKDPIKYDELQVGMLVRGVVKAVDTKNGVFIILKNSKLQALCHVSQISDAFVKDPAEHYEAGDRVKAVVTRLDADTKRISVALKVLFCYTYE